MFGAIAKREKGFTTVELITVLIIIGILAATSTSILIPSSSFQLQSSRDQVVAAISAAQQRAMSRQRAIRIVSTSSQIDIQEDSDGDGDFSPYSSVFIGGVQYPVSVQGNQSLSAATLLFNRLGQTSGTTVSLTQGSTVVSITVTDSGYAY